jgi:glutathionylspermidine synthase
LETIFSCCKWDPQVGDQPAFTDFPLIISRDTWRFLASQAEALASETVAIEKRLLDAPNSWRNLGLPGRVRRALASAEPPAAATFRVMRFDFHLTDNGWRISEVNSDVPGGFVEASGMTKLMAAHHDDCEITGDPAAAIAAAYRRRLPDGAAVGLVHATAYTDDRQAMVFLARHLEEVGLRPVLLSPANLEWRGGLAHSLAGWHQGQLAALFRFFPGEWLPNLERKSGWRHFFRGAKTPCANPAWALLSQSKRFALAADQIGDWNGHWRALQPETRDPRNVETGNAPEWVLKPALGRVGEDIGLTGVTNEKSLRAIRRSAHWCPGRWASQRRFRALPIATHRGPMFPCFGVYVIDGTAAGIYGRIAVQPLIDNCAQDIAVLIPRKQPYNNQLSTNL